MLKYLVKIFFLTAMFNKSSSLYTAEHMRQFNQSTLQLLHVFMRHGDRTPFHLYPNDPYNNEDFFPYTMGDLTNVGKNRAYNVGLALRRAYGQFLGDYYSPSIVNSMTSPFSRCVDSLILAVSGLFPTTGAQQWSHNANWQPIFYELDKHNDKLFLVYKNCPNFRVFQNEHMLSGESQAAFDPYEDIIMYTRFHTGEYIEKYVFMYNIYTTLLSEVASGLPVPTWATNIFPQEMEAAAKVEVDQMYKGTNKILGAGYVMAKIVSDTLLKLENYYGTVGHRLYIYSGHDMNVASILSWLDAYEPHLPSYGAYITFEIHVVDDVPYIKINYENYEYDVPEEIDIPNCGVFCPFPTFLELYESRLNADQLCGL